MNLVMKSCAPVGSPLFSMEKVPRTPDTQLKLGVNERGCNPLKSAWPPPVCRCMLIGTALLAFVSAQSAEVTRAYTNQPIPLVHAHAHNDYEHKRPLFDALDHGFCSVEADIYLLDGKLLVAHNRSDVKPERTLQSLYLDPLRERVRKNGGRVYANGPECILLIDLKSDWRTIYPVLREILKEYSDILSTFRSDAKETNAITAIITGNRSLEMFNGEMTRYAAYDGPLSELDSNASPNLIPWISSNWNSTFSWRGSGEMPVDQKRKLTQIVTRAHQHGRRVRFWATPDEPRFWREILAEGVDLINADNLEAAQKFLLKN
ncbi:MAG: hypothetical protein QOJ40_1800 [Verrucomicrobiota bacterium]